MPYEYVPTGLGATRTSRYKTEPASGRRVKTTAIKTAPVSTSSHRAVATVKTATARRVPLTAAKTPKVLVRMPAQYKVGVLGRKALPSPMVRVKGVMVRQLSRWLNRRFGTPTPDIRGLRHETGAIVLPKIWFNRFTESIKRVKRMRTRITTLEALAAREARIRRISAAAGRRIAHNKIAQFMGWWRDCQLGTWAAWDNSIVSGTGGHRAPATLFGYWDRRRNVRAVVPPEVIRVSEPPPAPEPTPPPPTEEAPALTVPVPVPEPLPEVVLPEPEIEEPVVVEPPIDVEPPVVIAPTDVEVPDVEPPVFVQPPLVMEAPPLEPTVPEVFTDSSDWGVGERQEPITDSSDWGVGERQEPITDSSDWGVGKRQEPITDSSDWGVAEPPASTRDLVGRARIALDDLEPPPDPSDLIGTTARMTFTLPTASIQDTARMTFTPPLYMQDTGRMSMSHPQMSGMGGPGFSGLIALAVKRAKQRRAEEARQRAERRALTERHNHERRVTRRRPAAQRIANARRRRQERRRMQIRSLERLRRLQRARVYNIVGSSRGIRARVAPSIRTAASQRRQNRGVPCPVGPLKDRLFGGTTSLIGPPALTASEARRRAANEVAQAAYRRNQHAARMRQLTQQPAAVEMTEEQSETPVTSGGEIALVDQEMDQIENAIVQSEEARTVVDEKEEQVIELEALLEETKDLFEEAKAQAGDPSPLPTEIELIRNKINELQGALTDAKIEFAWALFESAQVSQAQATMTQNEINRLSAAVQSQPSSAVVLQNYINIYNDDLAIAQQDIADSQSSLHDAQADLAQEAKHAAQTSEEISATEPFYVRHQTVLLLVGGAAAVGGGYWWWKRQQSEKTLTENEGYYDLPEPVTPSRPSGL